MKKSSWQVPHCQRPAERVGDVEVDLRPVEGAVAGIQLVLPPHLLERLHQCRLRHLPLRVGADRLLGTRRQLDAHVLEAEQRVQLVDRLRDVAHLGHDLILGAVHVCVVLRERAHAQQAVQHALALVARAKPELREPQRQLAIRVALGPVHQAGAGAVHRLDRELAPALALTGLREEHVLAVVVPVAGALPQLHVEDVRGADLLVVAALELLAHDPLDLVHHRSSRWAGRTASRATPRAA